MAKIKHTAGGTVTIPDANIGGIVAEIVSKSQKVNAELDSIRKRIGCCETILAAGNWLEFWWIDRPISAPSWERASDRQFIMGYSKHAEARRLLLRHVTDHEAASVALMSGSFPALMIEADRYLNEFMSAMLAYTERLLASVGQR